MPTSMTCACGNSMEVPEIYAGKRVHCPACKEPVLVTTGEQAAPSSATNKPDTGEAGHYATQPSNSGARPAGSSQDPDWEIQRRRKLEEAESLLRRVREAEAIRAGREDPGKSGGWFGHVNAGVGGGLAMMAIAVIWFFGALLLIDRIFFYPPILFVVGLIAVFKGLAKDE